MAFCEFPGERLSGGRYDAECELSCGEEAVAPFVLSLSKYERMGTSCGVPVDLSTSSRRTVWLALFDAPGEQLSRGHCEAECKLSCGEEAVAPFVLSLSKYEGIRASCSSCSPFDKLKANGKVGVS